ncbi:VOC family protein [Lentibacillus sp.]|uniref:VOC family protein n=1 Tax=Lentibacillus sp. TaxID=1925746 RepID=UPI002B4AFF28|nr:VOC family protein [Lentibacillus sp.]HLS08702.1 VOC family protein [Lentibacillus sp.]
MSFSYNVIDHVQLAAPVGGEEQAREFYRDVLGFEEIDKPAQLKKNGGVWFQCGHVHVHIGVEDGFVPAKKAHPAFQVINIAAMKGYLSESDIHYKVDDRLPGAERFYLSDPFGNRLEFLEWKAS